MSKKTAIQVEELKQLEPLASLSDERLQELAPLVYVEQLAIGGNLFREGDFDNQTIYLLSGEVQLKSSDGEIDRILSDKSDEIRFPLDDSQPRRTSCSALSRVRLLRIDNSVLDYMMMWDQMAISEDNESVEQARQEQQEQAGGNHETKPAATESESGEAGVGGEQAGTVPVQPAQEVATALPVGKQVSNHESASATRTATVQGATVPAEPVAPAAGDGIARAAPGNVEDRAPGSEDGPDSTEAPVPAASAVEGQASHDDHTPPAAANGNAPAGAGSPSVRATNSEPAAVRNAVSGTAGEQPAVVRTPGVSGATQAGHVSPAPVISPPERKAARPDEERPAATGDRSWIRKMRHIMAFKSMPPANIKKLLECMESVEVKAGETIIRQGEPGDYFYVLTEGEARVTRVIELATIEPGRSFGEEALISEDVRNASVTMNTDGVVMRLSKSDFNELLQEPMLQRLSPGEAKVMVAEGAVWLDVRHAREFHHSHLPNAINIPLHELRTRYDELDKSVMHVCYCSTGKRSSAAAFLLAQKGFKTSVLTGGVKVVAQDLQRNGKRGTHI